MFGGRNRPRGDFHMSTSTRKRSGHYLFTSESVTEGHPDKICDQVSDAILDAIYAKDPHGRVAVETLVTTGLCIVAGEVTTNAYIDVQGTIRQTIKDIGYYDADYGFDFDSCGVLVAIHEQSPNIAAGVFKAKEEDLGAGDQGLMFGYACNETPELMPLPITLAHKICKRLAELRHSKELKWLRPDGKSQVTVEYVDGKPKRVSAVVVSASTDAGLTAEHVRRDIIEQVVKPVCGRYLDDKTAYHINPAGLWPHGGPAADTGVTGRKIIVDTYGGVGSHGGGAFSGKDPTKVDRSASYMARHVAKNIVAAGLADEAEVQISYAIGVAEPLSVLVNTYGTGKLPDEKLAELVRKLFPLRPGLIIKYLNLRRPIYRKTAAYGHFGREDPDFTWEGTGKAEELKREAEHLLKAHA
jgi:S-adenosylmethionine synthetase